MSAVLYIRVYSKVTGFSSQLCVLENKSCSAQESLDPSTLAAAHLLAKLTRHILDTFTFPIESTHLWTDSQVTLNWIKSQPARWKDFVRNRVSHIQELVPSAHWRRVPGSGNPADCASRGVTVEQLSEHVLWWHGPQWLLKGDEHWPVQQDIIEPEAELEQRRAVTSVVVTQDSENYWLPISRLSSFVRLQRTTATVLLASQRMRKLSSSSELSTENLAGRNASAH
ncbi:unnamed protein product [Trichogramma brassicae]|uniref:Uncharacterized protein n=1 Tax=Trichogramma brassicae TaxID=86971 RepID=A0A6H5IV25_9HYME|nr:unnamed protein product [Trichogramma brassicae]